MKLHFFIILDYINNVIYFSLFYLCGYLFNHLLKEFVLLVIFTINTNYYLSFIFLIIKYNIFINICIIIQTNYLHNLRY